MRSFFGPSFFVPQIAILAMNMMEEPVDSDSKFSIFKSKMISFVARKSLGFVSRVNHTNHNQFLFLQD